jgi:hypothetical protein
MALAMVNLLFAFSLMISGDRVRDIFTLWTVLIGAAIPWTGPRRVRFWKTADIILLHDHFSANEDITQPVAVQSN